MSTPIGTYTFVPWLRRGIANRISGPPAAMRPTIDVTVQIDATQKSGGTTSTPIHRAVELYGPGDIIGIDSAQISRLEPTPWTTNFEPNYFVAIEFYDEDFPWRYTPAPPVDRKLLPWLALVVFEETTEFKEGGNVAGRPLSYVEVLGDFADVFPDPTEGWAWAHAHFNAAFSTTVVETDGNRAAQAAQHVIDTAPDTACSRLLCPRKLKPKTSYHAFLIPAFESGRLAGLGHDPKPLFDDAANGLTAMSSAWGSYGVPANRPDSTLFPFYHRWYFRTAENGDFESLVRLLKPKVVDSRVGHRDMDVTDPAPNVVGINDADLGGILRLGGALKAPFDTLDDAQQDEFTKFDEWATPYPHEFQEQLATFVNLADSYQDSGPAANADANLDGTVNDDPDPLITPPLYGRWHALTERLLFERNGLNAPDRTNWVHDLNLDPRWRVSAGFGTKVIQQNQEAYMEGAWDQIGDVLEANRRIRQAQLAKAAATYLHTVHLVGAQTLSPATLLMKAAPLRRRILSEGTTVNYQLTQSPMSVAMTSTAMRRLIRPGGKVAQRLNLTDPRNAADLITRANEGTISAVPKKTAPDKILTPDDLATATAPSGSDERWARIGKWIREHFILSLVLLLLLLLIILFIAGFGLLGFGVAAAVAVGAVAVWRRAQRADEQQTASDNLKENNQRPAVVDSLPASGNFTLTSQIDLQSDPPPVTIQRGETDNAEAARFKSALSNEYQLIETSRTLGQVTATTPLNLERVSADIVANTKPNLTVPRWTLSGLSIPDRIKEQVGDSFVEVMAYPEFDIPMYEPLIKMEKDGFVPNLHLVEPDSVTLLETNQRFIESYMVGLNHEFARELLWREYPTDQRGSYFRQFWDVRKKIAEATDKAAARESFKDIKPLHEWPPTNDLGENDNREVGPAPEEELVLVIRGELLKKYPNTIISAQKAKWQLKTDGHPDKAKSRELDESNPPMFPLYEARVAPDIYFFGFDLTALEARGDDTVDDKPGWFFRIEEVPGDARFGFDISRDAGDDINVWNDLAWADVVPGVTDGIQVKVSTIPSRTLIEPTGSEGEKHEQWTFDQDVPLDASLSAAELAYIALQTPVIMAIHASELLPNQES